jgi:hypothetical protein
MQSTNQGADFISLSNEIKLIIISTLHTDQDIKTLWSLCLTCRELLALAQPYLYRDIKLLPKLDLDASDVLSDSIVILFHRSLTDNATLRGYVRNLEFGFGNSILAAHYEISDDVEESHKPCPLLYESPVWTMMLELAAWLTKVRQLTIQHIADPATPEAEWELSLKAIDAMKELKQLHIQSGYRLDTRCLLLSLQNLTNLELLSLESRSSSSFTPERYINAPDVVPDLNLDKMRDLSLMGDAQTDWTEMLERFSNLKTINWVAKQNEIKPDLGIQHIFSPVMSTLQDLTLVFEASEPEDLRPLMRHLDIRQFGSLKRLFISDWMFVPQDDPFDIHQSLFTESLREFHWVYQEYSWEPEPWTKISPTNVELIKQALMLPNQLRLVELQLNVSNPLKVRLITQRLLTLKKELLSRDPNVVYDFRVEAE